MRLPLQVDDRRGAYPLPSPMDISPDELDRRIQRAKLDALKELAYGASHEINNPLANISARAQSLLRDEADPERLRALQAINDQAMRAHEMISDLMLFARPPALQLAGIDLAELAARLRESWLPGCTERRIGLAMEIVDEVVPIRGDDQQLLVAFGAIIRNAIEACEPRGSIVIRVRQPAVGETLASGEPISAVLEVDDDGAGLADEALQHCFDPFYSGREAGRGLGFGLSKCWRIVTQHGGDVRMENLQPRGARATVLLPAASPAEPIEPADSSPAARCE